MTEIWRCPKCPKFIEMDAPAKAMWCYHEKAPGKTMAVKMKKESK